MAINNLDSVISGASKNFFFYKTVAPDINVAGTYNSLDYSTWYITGIPSAAPRIYCSNSGYSFDTTTGGDLPYWTLPFIQPTGDIKTYIGNMTVPALNGSACQMMFCDRIWQSHIFALTGDTTHIIHSTGSRPFPPRDETGGSDGYGLLMGVEIVSAATGAAGINKPDSPIVVYTNHQGLANRTGAHSSAIVGIINLNSVPLVGAFFPVARRDQDFGIMSIQSIRTTGFSTAVGGPLSGQLVIYRPIEIFYPSQGIYGVSSSNTQYVIGNSVNRPLTHMYRGTTPFIITSRTNFSTGNIFGQYNYIIA